MPWTFRNAGAWGAGVLRKLTVAEGDGNTYETKTRIEALEASLPVPRGVAAVNVSGSTWTMTLQDGTILGPFTMPTTVLRPRGAWLPAQAYLGLDLVAVSGVGLYLVLQNHVSAATFDPDLQIGGTDVYQQVMNTSIISAITTISIGTQTPTVAQAGSLFRATNAAGLLVTLPLDATQPIPVNSVYQWEQKAAGQVVFIPESGALVINKPLSRDYRSAEQGATVSATKVAVNEWTIAGYLAALEA